MQAKQFNSQTFLESLCYIVFGILLFYFVYTEKYLSYVTPRMKPYLYFTVIIMIIWAIVSFFGMFRVQHKTRFSHCFVLVIPILLLFLPHSKLSTSDFSSNYVVGNGTVSSPIDNTQSSASDLSVSADIEEDYSNETSSDLTSNDVSFESSLDNTNTSYDAENDNPTYELPGLDEANKTITVNNEEFGLWLTELYANMQSYKDYTVVMTGFVFKDAEEFNDNEFVPARLIMTCCTADLAPTGFICEYDKASELEADSWVTVEGTLFIGQYEYNGSYYDEPHILVSNITPAEEVSDYVYPYY